MEALKLEGNESFKQREYSEAVSKYTQAIELDPQNALLYSNRSAAYEKLGSYEAAVGDARQCIRLKPGWYRGYYRKMVVSEALHDYAEVISCAQHGFRVTGEKTPKEEFAKRWLQASLALNKLPDGCGVELPDGIHILSQDYALVVAYLHRSLDGEHPMSQSLAQQCLMECGEQLEAVLTVFGEPTHASIKSFTRHIAADIYSHDVQPSRKAELVKQAKDRGDEFVSFVAHQVDPALHPVLRPILALMALIVLSRTNVLCEANTGHHTAELMNRSILLLFESKLLGTPEYAYLHIGRLCAVLDSFDGRGYLLNPIDVSTLQHYCNVLETTIGKYPHHRSDYMKNKDLADRALENTRKRITRPSTYAPTQVMNRINTENASNFMTSRPEEVGAYAIQRLAELQNVIFLTLAEVEEILSLSGIFYDLKNEDTAMKAFLYGEQSFFKVLAHNLEKGVLRLDQCSSTIALTRQYILLRAKRFNNSRLFADMAIRWKGLFGEFRSQLIQRGLGEPLATFFQGCISSQMSSSDKDSSIKHSLTKLITEEEAILRKSAKLVLTSLSRQSYSLLQQKLDKKTVMLDYVFYIPLSDSLMNAHCVVTEADKEPIVFDLNYNAIRTQAAFVVDCMKKIRDRCVIKKGDLEAELSRALAHLSLTLLPECVVEVLLLDEKNHIYVRLDQDIASIPFDMLTVKHTSFGQVPMLDMFSVSTLSSLHCFLDEHQVEPSEEKLVTYIISNPNFDLAKDKGVLYSLTSLFSDYLSLSDSSTLESLKHSKSEADFIECVLKSHNFGVKSLTGDEATLANVLAIQNPLILHFSTHAYGFSRKTAYHSNFFSELESAIALTGFNTYSRKQFDRVLPECSVGQLPSLAIASMQLKGTKLVYLSTCNSSLGEIAVQESISSLAQGFLNAGVKTVIATLWTVDDASAAEFAKLFYGKLLSRGTRPSQALCHAKSKLKEDSHWRHWAGFVCYGLDEPI